MVGPLFFIVKRSGLEVDEIKATLGRARVPPIPEIAEQFDRASLKLLDAICFQDAERAK